MAGDTVPAIRSDIATAGAEYWIGGAWIAGLTVYRRRATGIAEPDPTPGPFSTRPIFVPAVNTARGAEASLRRLTGRWTPWVSLAVSRSEMMALGFGYAAPNDRHRVLQATALLRATRALRVGGAFTVASGAAFTRFVGSHAPCGGTGPACGDTTPTTPVPYVETAGGARAPGYATLDLLLDWTHAYRSWSLAAYLQLRNALETSRRRGELARLASEDAPPHSPADPGALLERAELRRRVRAALEGLSHKERTALLLREEGFGHREIAAAVGTTTGSVGTLVARALAKLARLLDLREGSAP